MYQLNAQLVLRPDDRTFFDPSELKVIRLNRTGYTLVELFQTPLTEKQFMERARGNGFAEGDLKRFLERCIESNVLVAAK